MPKTKKNLNEQRDTIMKRLLSACVLGLAFSAQAQQVIINTDVRGRPEGTTTVMPNGTLIYADKYGSTTGQGAVPVPPVTQSFSPYTPSPFTPDSYQGNQQNERK